MLNCVKAPVFLIAVLLMNALLVNGAHASELGTLFAAYQSAVEEGDTEKVRESAAGVYEYTRKTYPEDNKNRAAATLNYTKALFADREYELAEEIAREALARYESVYGEESLDLVDPQLELARAIAGNRRSSAEHRRTFSRYLNKALKLVEDNRGEASALYAVVALDAGRISLDQAGSPRARKYLEIAQEAFDGPYQEHTLKRFLASFYLGKFYMAKEQYRTARPYLESALEIADTDGAPDGALELTARAFLVDIYEQVGEEEMSIAQCRAIGKMVPFNMDQEPRSLYQRMPEYPASALRNNREGYAVVKFTISDTGIPADVTAIDTEGSTSFGGAAEEYVKGLRYAPRFVDGKAVDTPDRKVKISFNLAK
ncbi:energy transducer TonB [uncultured Microbulbifer sp.]|uniref:energy transducer TonB n=1 Tax=uncultured Microbulbifer sp. TaxID=348147 RepID=UPI0025FC5A43|nr:TonB family protein [uncultured Microbulbifer sp.]